MKRCQRLQPRVLVSAALLIAPALPLVRQRLNIELNPASSGLGGAGMGTGAIRKGDHYESQ